MNVASWLKLKVAQLEQAGIATARLDCLVLLEHASGKDRAWLLARPEYELTEATFHNLEELIARREKHEPLAYILGKTEFYGREFTINRDVLEPRPESETIIELLKEELGAKEPDSIETRVVDVGTGSGALAITAKLEFPELEVVAIDIDPNCLKVAKTNARLHNVQIEFLEGDLLLPLQNLGSRIQNPIIIANLPYVPDTYKLNPAAYHEPSLAIFGGKDGLDLYRTLFEQAATLSPSLILTESLPLQHKELAQIARTFGFRQIKEDDFIQAFCQALRG